VFIHDDPSWIWGSAPDTAQEKARRKGIGKKREGKRWSNLLKEFT